MPRNGLTNAALSDPDAQAILGAIASSPLTDVTLSTVLNSHLTPTNRANVVSLLEYVVSCALEAGARTELDAAGSHFAWHGEVGLCGGTSPFGNWATAAPTRECKEIVSACVLARVNALHKKVIISARGTSSCILPLQPTVPVEQEYRECGGTAIRSFGSCPASGCTTTADAAKRDYGWTARYVGSCTPNTPVKLHVTTPDTVVRVCHGIYGCDFADSPPPASSCSGTPAYGTPWYSGVIGSFHPDPSSSVVTFTCPDNDLLTPTPSYFAIMVASSSTAPLASGADVTVAGGGATYPATETEVFTFREGAFFGNVFTSKPASKSPNNFLVGQLYACYSDVWTDGIAHDADRLCAGIPCFDNAPEP
jgi:hypothetical protein